VVLFPKPYADRVARLRVPGGFMLVAAFAWFSRPTLMSLAWSVPVSLVGLVLRAWAAGCLAKNRELAITGPYAYTRNPLYLGTLLVAAGVVIASRQMDLAALFAAVFLLVYLPVIQLEEQHLRKLFPEYEAYARSVPALWPCCRRHRPPTSRNTFTWRTYLKNREYQAAAGYAAGLALLVWKAAR
jgi:protein-S-isoprenylcysteine O-methyltransferase Ste14